jgi:hypothetical protein
MKNNHEAIVDVLVAAGRIAARGDQAAALLEIKSGAPFAARTRTKRGLNDTQKFHVWKSDGFCCRYTGERLFLPIYLRALSELWPTDFPYQVHWKSDETHDAHWSHGASIEHVDPIAFGGAETVDNWITTSGARNQVRSRHSLDQLGWTISERPAPGQWDGGSQLFLDLLKRYPTVRSTNACRKWATIVQRAGLGGP